MGNIYDINSLVARFDGVGLIWERCQDLPIGELESEATGGVATKIVLGLLSEPT